jgi:hypothetical protein
MDPRGVPGAESFMNGMVEPAQLCASRSRGAAAGCLRKRQGGSAADLNELPSCGSLLFQH